MDDVEKDIKYEELPSNLTNLLSNLIMFTSLCVPYGAGKRFITMLNHLGLTFSWKNFVDYLDKQLQHKEEVLKSRFKELLPVIIMMDNINMYQGKRKHLRLFKYVGPKMWNFTGRGVFFPNLDSAKHLLSAKQKYFGHKKMSFCSKLLKYFWRVTLTK